MASCPTTAQLEALVRGKLAAEDRMAVEKHLISCKRCATEVRRLRDEEALFADLKGALGDKVSVVPVHSDATVSSAPAGKSGRAASDDDPLATIDPSGSGTTQGRAATPAFDPRGPMSVESDDVMATISSDAPSKPAAKRSAGAPSQLFEIEGYEILAELSRGGQGAVYKAVQKATKRTVALKVLLAGAGASKRQLERFEREIDLAASLRHPNIITVYDSGVTGGMHYLVMEFVRGDRLDVYLSRKKPTLETTLRLFLKICAAVNHAHRHGVIHRDLKPGNVLVDANGEPYILDFGLAKAVGKDVVQGRGLTLTSEFVGTLAYASPEQTEGKPELIDVRTDVYSLGVILYEMVTGHLPYSVAGALGEVLKNIAQAVPERPSTWHSKSKAGDDEGIPITAHRIKDDLETIILKALSKEPDRRYQSVDALGGDVERFLKGDAIDAKRDSLLYMVRKAARKSKLVSVCLLAVLFAWFGAGTFGIWSGNKEREARKQKEAALTVATDALQQQEKVAQAAISSLRTSRLGWFLHDWHVGALDRLKAIQATASRGDAHWQLMGYMIDPEGYPFDKLLSQIPADLLPAAHYAHGERLLKEGHKDEAIAAYQQAIASRTAGSEDFIVMEARARIAQLRKDAPPSP